jgi:hypothetical protein
VLTSARRMISMVTPTLGHPARVVSTSASSHCCLAGSKGRADA